MLSTKSSVSRRKPWRSASSKSGNTLCTGAVASRLRRNSHWPAKLRTNASAFGLASIRRTCCSSTAGRPSCRRAASASSSSSGMLLHRKNESRDASSRSLTRYGDAGRHARRIALDAEQELRADEQAAQRALDARARTCRPRALRDRTRAAVRGRPAAPDAGRRGCASDVRMRVAHAASATAGGRHVKSGSRAGDVPAGTADAGAPASGPSISTLRRWAPSRVSGMFTPDGIRAQERQARRLVERRGAIDEGHDDVALAGLHRHAQVPRSRRRGCAPRAPSR